MISASALGASKDNTYEEISVGGTGEKREHTILETIGNPLIGKKTHCHGTGCVRTLQGVEESIERVRI
jgi:hypothetical protein